MRTRFVGLTWLVALARLAALIVVLAASVAVSAQEGTFAIKNVRIFDGAKVIAKGTVVVKDGKISAVGAKVKIPSGIPVLDGSGKTLLPGLFDSHLHLADSGKAVGGVGLEEAAAYGITTVLDLNTGNPVDYEIFLKRVKSGEFPDGADLFTSGPGAIPPQQKAGGEQVLGPDQAKAWVDEHKAKGASYIKIFFDDQTEVGRNVPILDDATVKAVIDAAHQDGFLTVAHAMQEKRVRQLVDDGLDGLAHVSPAETFSPDFGQYLAAHHVYQTTNLISYAPPSYKAELAADPDLAAYMPASMIATLKSAKVAPTNHSDYAVANLKNIHAAHVPILAGTDSFYPYPPALHAELEIYVTEAGFTPLEALAAATANPAETYHLSDRGRIAPGLRADLLLVSGDPTTNILDTRKVFAVWKAGHKIDREALQAKLPNMPVAQPVGGGPPPAATAPGAQPPTRP